MYPSLEDGNADAMDASPVTFRLSRLSPPPVPELCGYHETGKTGLEDGMKESGAKTSGEENGSKVLQ